MSYNRNSDEVTGKKLFVYEQSTGRNMAKVKVDEKELEALIRDAERYRFIRDEDNWGEDSGEDCWEILGESSRGEFDSIVDIRMASSSI